MDHESRIVFLNTNYYELIMNYFFKMKNGFAMMGAPMSPLLSASDSSSESELSAAESKPPSTPSGHSFNPLENHLKNP